MGISYPEKIKGLYPEDARKYREILNDIVLGYLKSDSLEADIVRSSDRGNFIIPYKDVLNALNNPFDIIGPSILTDDGCSLFVEDRANSTANSEGYGKTALFLELLGIDIPYKEILAGKKETFVPKNKEIWLISSDISYLGEKEGRLALGAVIGENLVARWDLARHIWRVGRGPEYVSGEQRTQQIRDYLIELGEQILLDAGAFADNTTTYPVSTVFAIKREPEAKEILAEKLPLEERLPKIKNLLGMNPVYHSSPFWKINKGEHELRVERIINKLEPENIPEIYRLVIPVDNSSAAIKEAAKAISELLQ